MRRKAEEDGQRFPQTSRRSGSSRVDDDQSDGCVRRTGRVPLESRKPLCRSTRPAYTRMMCRTALHERARRSAPLASVSVRVSPCVLSAIWVETRRWFRGDRGGLTVCCCSWMDRRRSSKEWRPVCSLSFWCCLSESPRRLRSRASSTSTADCKASSDAWAGCCRPSCALYASGWSV